MTVAIKIKCLPEPTVQFNNGHEDVDPRRALVAHGPVDNRGRHFRLGLIGLASDVAAARRWIGDIDLFRPAKEKNARRYRDWPGAERALKAKFEIDDNFVRVLDDNAYDRLFRPPVGAEAFEALVEMFEGPMVTMFGDARPDCIVVCIPDELGDLRVENPGLSPRERRALQILKREEESAQLDLFAPSQEDLAEAEALRTSAEDLLFRTFYRALKSRVHKYDNAVPIQVLRRGTIERDDNTGQSQATRNWNFTTALYYKGGGLPWRPSGLTEGVCFVGVSFHHLKKRGGHLVYASVAQAFSSDHEPFCLKGAHIDHQQRIDRQPYLNESQAYSLMKDVMEGYRLRTGLLPKRIVVHKTSVYQSEEEKGFRRAVKGSVPGCDLVWLRQTPFRLVRKGAEEPWRGTLCQIEGESFLFTSGYVPWWEEFPGAHIPSPIQIGSAGETDIEARAREILLLSKMNWNSSDGITRLPVTLLFAKRVGEIMTELSDNVAPNPSFRFHT
ncbi:MULTISPECIES: hypothetical protein [unclassified Bradyrhizobium]|uniref:hypothetical protein n=1 Tax=unclassified Bradyrhizobium TaxID=2631580 RepID=UPI0029167AA4|nr:MULTISPECIES: hypothetical protein [unclassified Bradyrhizobium]